MYESEMLENKFINEANLFRVKEAIRLENGKLFSANSSMVKVMTDRTRIILNFYKKSYYIFRI